MYNIGVVIVSDAKDQKLYKITDDCIKSVLNSESHTYCSFDIVVVESNKNVRYNDVKTIHPTELFNYNRYLNIGYKSLNNNVEYISFCNNDILFTKGWFRAYEIAGFEDVMCSFCKYSFKHSKYRKDKSNGKIEGKEVSEHFTGWAFTISKKLYIELEGFDEYCEFWCADNLLVEHLLQKDKKIYLYTGSNINHLGSKTLNTISGNVELYDKLTKEQVIKFNQRYKKNIFGWH